MYYINNVQKNPTVNRKRNPKFVTLQIKKEDDLKTEEDIEKAEMKLRNVRMQVAEFEKTLQNAKQKLKNNDNQDDDQTVVQQEIFDLKLLESMKHYQEWSDSTNKDDVEKEYERWLWPKLKAESKAKGGNEKTCFIAICDAAIKSLGPHFTSQQYVSV